ncbi:1664_t:CDS:2 [Gigaspora margarita]|uniref:1664_t:CDS:1 n=1 Tax=Gigaspora margarita TaxID=4874 RepID=A0ABN7UV94_GIGMA|nr:1664_t:CDS:2 [Gigaspora margarita]
MRFYGICEILNFGSLILKSDHFDVGFSLVYKFAPLVSLASSTVIGLFEHYIKDISYSFNRKEIKDHGEN